MRKFFATDINQSEVLLDQEESKHLARVLRLKEGANVILTNGKGEEAEAVVHAADKNSAILRRTGDVIASPFPGIRLTIAVAATRHADRFEWMAEKLTEAGVYAIQPLTCTRSETRGEIKRSRLEKILLNAMKQSQRSWLPVLHETKSFDSFVKEEPEGFIAWCGDPGLPHISLAYQPDQAALNILIGPEGDFTEEEFNTAISAGYNGINLGTLRLRTETAALAACMAIKIGYEKS